MNPYPLVIFDRDGVLTNHISSWMYVHTYFDVDNEQGYENYKAGKIDDLEFMSSDIRLWKQKKPDITLEDVRGILDEIPLMPGTREVFSVLKEKGIKTAIISGGIDPLADRLAEEFGIQWVKCNGLETDGNGCLTGEGIRRVSLHSKAEAVVEIADKTGVEVDRIAAIGDTRIDAGMLKMCGLGIAFDPKDEITRNSADIVIEKLDLREILPYIVG